MKIEKTSAKPTMSYRLFKGYVRLYHNKIYYKKSYTVGAENIPEECPLLIVSNHQNSLCDPLALLFSIRNRRGRKVRVISRADVFNRPKTGKFLNWLGILPAYRLAIDGEDYQTNNLETFESAENELLNDGTVVIFPEGKHQNKRWLGKFSSGYLHIAFEAAEKSNFEKEIFILPSCNHYSDFFNTKEDVLIKFGKPISLAPFYELYKTKPRTAQRQVNALVREQVEELMLNVTDLENYEAFDYLRNTYGVRYAEEQGYNPDKLPEKLLADKKLYKELESAKTENPELIQSIYDDTLKLKQKTEQLGLEDACFDKKNKLWRIFLELFLFALFFPLFLIATFPNLMIVYAPTSLTKNIKDPMLHSSFKFAIGILLTVPVLYMFSFLFVWKVVTGSFLFSIIFLSLLPVLGAFAVNYKKRWRSLKKEWIYFSMFGNGELFDLISLRQKIYNQLDELLSMKYNNNISILNWRERKQQNNYKTIHI